MYFDAFTISALVDEFLDTFVGGRVQDTIDVEPYAIGLEIYANGIRHYLYMSADQQTPRVHLVDDKLRRGVQKPTQLGLMFRRYVEGGTVSHVSQPEWERILHIDVEGPEGLVTIIIEPMPRRSNILLVQDGTILDCMRRVGPEDNRYRLSLPAHEYVPPPPLTGKRNPFKRSHEDFVGFFTQNHDPKRKAHQVLTSHLLGMSPLLAKEVIYRVSGDENSKADDVDAESVFEVWEDFSEPLSRRQWESGIVETDGVIEAFSVYPIQFLDGWVPTDSISASLAAFYGAPVGEDAYNAAKKPIFEALEEAKAKLEAKLNSMENSVKDDAERELLKQSGELILAYQYTLEKGQTELRAQYDMDAPELVIKLDPELSPLENAQRYFNQYNKAKRAQDEVPERIDETKQDLAYLDQLWMDLEVASNWPDIDEVRQALQQKGLWRGKPARRIGGGQSAPIKFVTPDGFVIWVGRNSRQNEIVSFRKASGDDLWLHARDVPGAHVVIKNDGRRISEEVIDMAAALAAYYSKLRNESKVPVDVTRIKYVRKIKGGGAGMVTYRNESTRLIEPQSEESLSSEKSG